MPFAQNYAKKPLSPEEKRRAILLIAEMKSRGIPIPDGLEVPDDSTVGLDWNLDGNGYFVKNDGKKFSPRQVLIDFINDESRFILLKSGRGGGKTTGGAQKALKKIREGKSGAVMSPDFENFRTST